MVKSSVTDSAPDPLVRGKDPDPSINMQKLYEKPLFLPVLFHDFFMTFFLSLKDDVNVASKSNKQKKNYF
jgi:hypothetical protein